MNISEIYERDPVLWDQTDLETVIAALRAERQQFLNKEAEAALTGKKIKTKKPSFTKHGKLAELPEELQNLDLDL